MTSRFIEPAPPDRIVLSTGAPGGEYQRFGDRYRDYLAWHGVTLELRASNGSVDNVRRLQRGEADAAFVQGGTIERADDDADADATIVSLGGLYPEIVWVFVRDAAATLASSRVAGSRSVPRAAACARSRSPCSARWRGPAIPTRRCCRSRARRPPRRWCVARRTPSS